MMGARAADRKGLLAGLAWLESPAMYIASFFLPVLDEPPYPLLGYGAFMAALHYPPWLTLITLASGRPGWIVVAAAIFPSWLANVAYWVAGLRLLCGDRR